MGKHKGNQQTAAETCKGGAAPVIDYASISDFAVNLLKTMNALTPTFLDMPAVQDLWRLTVPGEWANNAISPG